MRRPIYFLTLVVLFLGFAMMPGRASSHREAPLISADPQADTTDVYAFLSPDNPDMVTLIASYIPFEDPAGGPNFFRFGDSVLYEIKIDNNGDAVEDISYQLRFTSQLNNPNTFLYGTGQIRSLDDPNRNMFQTYTLSRVQGGTTVLIAGPMRTMYDNIGVTTPNYGGNGSGIYEFRQPDGTTGRVFAGQTDDAFFLDLRVFDLLYGGNLSETGVDTLAGFNVHSIAIQVPKNSLKGASPIIGVCMMELRPSAAAYARVAYARELQGNLNGAVQAMELAADATAAEDPEALAWHQSQLGDLYLRLGKVREAESAYIAASHSFPGHPFAVVGYSRVLAARGDLTVALTVLQELAQDAPTPDLAARLGDLLERIGRADEAERQFAIAEAGWRTDAPEPKSLARFLADRDRKIDEAVAIAERAAAARHDIFTEDVLAWAYFKAGRREEAGRAIARALRTGTKDADILAHARAIGVPMQAARR